MKTLVLILISASLTFCGQEKKKPEPGPIAAPYEEVTKEAKAALIGTWGSDCDETKVKVGRTFNEDNTGTTFMNSYEDSDCTTMTYQMVTSFTYEVTGTNQINMTYGKSTATFKTQAYVDDANSSSLYGLTNWKLNVANDVTGLLSDPSDPTSTSVPKENVAVYTIFKNPTKTTVQFGDLTDEHDGKTPENRPVDYKDSTLHKI